MGRHLPVMGHRARLAQQLEHAIRNSRRNFSVTGETKEWKQMY